MNADIAESGRHPYPHCGLHWSSSTEIKMKPKLTRNTCQRCKIKEWHHGNPSRWREILSHDRDHMNTPAHLSQRRWQLKAKTQRPHWQSEKGVSGNHHHHHQSKLEVIINESIPSQERNQSFPVRNGRAMRTRTQPWPHFTAERALIMSVEQTRKNWTEIKEHGEKNHSAPRMNTPTHSKQLPILPSDTHRQSSQPLEPPSFHCPPAGMKLGADNTNNPSVRNGNTISGCCHDGLTVQPGCWWSNQDNPPFIRFNWKQAVRRQILERQSSENTNSFAYCC